MLFVLVARLSITYLCCTRNKNAEKMLSLFFATDPMSQYLLHFPTAFGHNLLWTHRFHEEIQRRGRAFKTRIEDRLP